MLLEILGAKRKITLRYDVRIKQGAVLSVQSARSHEYPFNIPAELRTLSRVLKILLQLFTVFRGQKKREKATELPGSLVPI